MKALQPIKSTKSYHYLFILIAFVLRGAFASTHDFAIAGHITRNDGSFEFPDLLKRQCDYDTPCKGYGWSHQLHCGDGKFGCVEGNVYQIGSDTNVCNYGVRKSCQQCGKLTC